MPKYDPITDCHHIGYDHYGRAVWVTADEIEREENKRKDENDRKLKEMIQKGLEFVDGKWRTIIKIN